MIFVKNKSVQEMLKESILNNKWLDISPSLSLSLANNNKRISYGGTVNQSIRVARPNFVS